MKPFIFKYFRKYEPKLDIIPFFYNKAKEIIESINLRDIEEYDSNYIIYATGTDKTASEVDPTRDEAMDR